MTKKICISGYYGFNNFGDETILKILVSNIKHYFKNAEITVFSSNPEKTAAELSVKSTYTFNIKSVIKSIIQSECLISGGGSLLQDVTSTKSLIYYLSVLIIAQLFRKKTIIFAQGIGPINNKFLFKLTKYVIKKATFISVRDEKSYNLLNQAGINAKLLSDPVWNLQINNKDKLNRIAVQLREHNLINDNFLFELAKSVNEYYSEKEIVLLSLQNKLDLDICNKFKDILFKINPKLNIKIIENTSNEIILDNIVSCKELIAMRYHACLTGIKAGIKVLPISYDIKVAELANEFSLKYIDLSDINNINNTINYFKTSYISPDRDKINSKQFDFELMLKKI